MCGMNSALLPGKIGQFRVIPYAARAWVKFPSQVVEMLDLSEEELDALQSDICDVLKLQVDAIDVVSRGGVFPSFLHFALNLKSFC